jgi:Cro/C1-type HTH DNA-binding domain
MWAAPACSLATPTVPLAGGLGGRQAAVLVAGVLRRLALWGQKPITVRLDDLDKICAALGCTVADLLEAEPLAAGEGDQQETRRAAGAADDRTGAGPARPIPRRGGNRRALPPN